MKRTITLLLGLLIGSSLFSQGIKFDHITFKEALVKAKLENKMIFMDCYTSWCGPCKKMAKQEFTKSNVGEYFNSNFVCLKVDMEKGEGVDLKKRFNVKGFPTLLYIDCKGEIVSTRVGAVVAEVLISDGKSALNPDDKLEILAAKYEKGDRDNKLVIKYIDHLLKNQMFDLLNIVATNFIDSLSNEDLFVLENFECFLKLGTEFNSDKHKFVKNNKDKFILLTDKLVVKGFLIKTFFSYLRELSKGTDKEKLDLYVADFKQEFSDKIYIPFIGDVYRDFYNTNNQYDNWIDECEKNLEYYEIEEVSRYCNSCLYYSGEITSNPIFLKSERTTDLIIKWADRALPYSKNPEQVFGFLAYYYKIIGNKKEAISNVNESIKVCIDKNGKFFEELEKMKKEIEDM